jgi:hypothetical protein
MTVGSLISLGGNLEDPRNAKASDFGSGDYASGPAGQSSGAMQLVKQTTTQEGCMHTQDSGPETPSVWGKADFPVGKSKGEGGLASTSLSIKGSINCQTGQMEPNATAQTY